MKLAFPRFKTWFGPCLSQIGLLSQHFIDWVDQTTRINFLTDNKN